MAYVSRGLRILGTILLICGAVLLAVALYGSIVFEGVRINEVFSPFNLKTFVTVAVCLAPGGLVYWLGSALKTQ